MSPVRQRRQRDSRAVLVAVITLVVGVAAVIVLVVYGIPKLTENDTVKVNLGTDTFDAGTADNLLPSVQEAPLLLPDVANGDRDLYLQHVGTDPLTGWLAFDARRPGQPRACNLRWDAAAGHFVDPCDGTVVAADGAGLTHSKVTVNPSRHVIVDLKADAAAGAGGPAGSPPSSLAR